MPVGIQSYSSGTKSEGTGKIYVGGMPPSLSEAHLHVYFSQFGTVANVTLIRDRETGKINCSLKSVKTFGYFYSKNLPLLRYSIRSKFPTISGISKGFGFVTFCREEEAGNVVTMMGNHVIERRPVRVSFASTQGQSQNNKKG